jgi:cytochrome c55X
MVFVLGAPALQASEAALDEYRLARLVRHDCGACHGMTLKGGLGPELLPAALAGKPPEFLQWVILNGRPGTAMPAWSALLTPAEAAWIAKRLRAGLPDAR